MSFLAVFRTTALTRQGILGYFLPEYALPNNRANLSLRCEVMIYGAMVRLMLNRLAC